MVDRFYEKTGDLMVRASDYDALCSEGAIKDRALVVARSVLEELCAFIWENFEDPVRKEHILRARDQVMNAKLGKLSSDPFPVSTRLDPANEFPEFKKLGTVRGIAGKVRKLEPIDWNDDD